MKTGLLWFDDSAEKGLADKVLQATAHYEHKFGQPPTTCFAHPDALDGRERPLFVGEVAVRPRRATPPHHFWLGVDERDQMEGQDELD